jgi:hypothetical protein
MQPNIRPTAMSIHLSLPLHKHNDLHACTPASWNVQYRLSLPIVKLIKKLNIVCILSFKLPRNPRNPRENSPCFYRVIETRFFWAFDQSAPVFLKGYFIITNNSWRKYKRNHDREGICICDTIKTMLIYVNCKFNFLTKYTLYHIDVF